MMDWVRLRQDGTCAYGCHIPKRSWAMVGRRARRHFVRRFIVCEGCAHGRYGLTRPVAEAKPERDGKALAIGNDE